MKIKRLTLNILSLAALLASSTLYSFAFVDNNGAPPSGNTAPPINTSTTTQVKEGVLQSNSSLRAPIFYDSGNTGYYVDPNATSRMNYILTDTVYSNGAAYSSIVYDSQNSGYFVDPNASSRISSLYGDYIYSYGNMDANDVYIRSVGKWVSQIANSSNISVSTHTLQAPDGGNGQVVNAKYCAISSQSSFGFDFFDTDGVNCTTYPINGSQWYIYAIGWDNDRPDVVNCSFSCIR